MAVGAVLTDRIGRLRPNAHRNGASAADHVLVGVAAGAIGTAALNVVTYLDMLARGRPESEVPKDTVETIAERTGIESLTSGNGGRSRKQRERAPNRASAVGALLGYVVGLGVGAAYGLVRPRLDSPPIALTGAALGFAAMAGSDVPATALGVTDPRSWGVSGWAGDLAPHLAYGLATALAFEAFFRRGR